jgi:hypothetical protein
MALGAVSEHPITGAVIGFARQIPYYGIRKGHRTPAAISESLLRVRSGSPASVGTPT